MVWWTWVRVGSESWWWAGKPGILQSMGSQRVGHDWETELNWRSFFYSSSKHSCHLLISSVSVRSLSFLSFIMPNLVCNAALISLIFLIAPYSLSFYCFSLSFHCSCKKAFLSLLAILWKSAFSLMYLSLSPLPFASLLPQLFVKALQTTTLPYCISFSLGWFWSPPPVQCYRPPSIVLQVLCLPDLIPWIYSSPPLYNHSVWFRSCLNGLVVFPAFFNLSLNFAMRSSWSEPQSAHSLVIADFVEFLHLWLQRT